MASSGSWREMPPFVVEELYKKSGFGGLLRREHVLDFLLSCLSIFLFLGGNKY